MIKEKSRSFKDIIEEMKDIYLEFGNEKLIEDDDWCIYTVEEKLEPNTECYIFDYPDYDDETGEEILPEYAVHDVVPVFRLNLPDRIHHFCFLSEYPQSVLKPF